MDKEALKEVLRELLNETEDAPQDIMQRPVPNKPSKDTTQALERVEEGRETALQDRNLLKAGYGSNAQIKKHMQFKHINYRRKRGI